MEKIEFQQLRETLYHETMENGLNVYVLPKQGFHKTYATFTTKYGSIDNHFIPPGKSEVKVPDGIAHFLEHKMFEDEKEDVFERFSRYGAQANAFTSFDRTTYLFSATEHIEQNLSTLLNFVQHTYFTTQNVDKEKGIIEQEIRMYQDNPDWRAYFGLINALYHQHPVRVDIAGTVESIYQIDKDLLQLCYDTFYHPSNMLLFVVGAVDPRQVLDLVRDNQQQKQFESQQEIKRLFDDEPDTVAQKINRIELSIGQPKCLLGYKELNLGLQGEDLLRLELETRLLLNCLFGSSTDFYHELLDEELIDDSFGTDYNVEYNYGFSIVGGNTNDPERLIQRIEDYVERKRQSGVEEHVFERIRKKMIGQFLRQINAPEFIANQFTRYQFNQMNLFEVIPTLEAIRYQDVNRRFEEHFQTSLMASCIVT